MKSFNNLVQEAVNVHAKRGQRLFDDEFADALATELKAKHETVLKWVRHYLYTGKKDGVTEGKAPATLRNNLKLRWSKEPDKLVKDFAKIYKKNMK